MGKPELEDAFGQWVNTTLNLESLKSSGTLSRAEISSMTTRGKQHSRKAIRKARFFFFFFLVLLPSERQPLEVRWTGRGWGRFGESYLGFMGFFFYFSSPFPITPPSHSSDNYCNWLFFFF